MTEAGKFIDFIITQKCTYKCRYCSQSKNETKDTKDANETTILNFLNFLDTINNDYEIAITGGEALLHPLFFKLIKEIKNKGFKINLITNLSFDIKKYQKIFDLLNESLNRFDISFHLDEIADFDIFLDKLNKIINLKPTTTKTAFLIPVYNINQEKERKIDLIIKTAQKKHIEYDFQHIHFFDKYKKNSDTEQKFIKNKPLKSFSKLCYSGCYSAVIYENGEIYRCYSSRFLKSNYLGNINDKNFKLNNKPIPCSLNFCTCPKPKIYNQILNQRCLIKAVYFKIYNYIFMPYYLLKNMDIVKTKLKQYFKQK